jgi:hypothetical protein
VLNGSKDGGSRAKTTSWESLQHRIRIREFHIDDVGHAHAAANRELDAVGTTGNERTVHSHFRAVSLQSPVDSAL